MPGNSRVLTGPSPVRVANDAKGLAMRRFLLVRKEDVSGVSGTGIVAEGVVFSNGKVVMSWYSEYRSVTVFDSVHDLETVHGHEGRTRIMWVDPPARGDSRR